MKKVALLFLMSFAAACLHSSCAGDDQSGSDTSTDDDTETESTDTEEHEYVCIDDSVPVDEAACGPYPADESDVWDLEAVVPNMEFIAYYDRNCDGEVELTTMDMYRDVYCQRDRIKSLVLVVGSYCGEQTGST